MTDDPVLSALARLSVLPERRDRVEALASDLHLLAGFARLDDLPRSRNSRKKDGARQEIERMAEICRELGAHLLSMHSDALRALEATGGTPHPLAFLDQVKRQIFICLKALEEGEFPEPVKGAPPKRGAAKITAHIRNGFEFLTGKPATIVTDPITNKASGDFLELVQALLPALGFKASAESQARAAIRARG